MDIKKMCEEIFKNKIYPCLTDCIFFYLQNDREFMDEYLSMSRPEQEDFNREMGKAIKKEFGLSNAGKCHKTRSVLIKSYTKHCKCCKHCKHCKYCKKIK